MRYKEKKYRQKKVNLIGAISCYGPVVGLLTFENVTASMYTKALKAIKYKLSRKGLKDIIVVHDNAKIHFQAEKLLKSQKFNFNTGVRHPAYSPDLNPIENAFHLTKSNRWKDKSVKVENLVQLSAGVKKWLKSLSTEVCTNLIRSLPNRADAVIRSRGGATKY